MLLQTPEFVLAECICRLPLLRNEAVANSQTLPPVYQPEDPAASPPVDCGDGLTAIWLKLGCQERLVSWLVRDCPGKSSLKKKKKFTASLDAQASRQGSNQ